MFHLDLDTLRSEDTRCVLSAIAMTLLVQKAYATASASGRVVRCQLCLDVLCLDSYVWTRCTLTAASGHVAP